MSSNGVAAFKRRLAKVPAGIRKEVAAAHAKNAAEWVRQAKALAPDDPRTTGADLKASIRHYPTETGGQVVRAGGETTTKDGFDYATAQEWGTSKMERSPFFWVSYRLFKKRFDARRRRAINKAIKAFNDG